MAASAADAERKPRRVIVMSWFPKALKDRKGVLELCRIPHVAATIMLNQAWLMPWLP
jgi:hypothetical protein